MENECTTDFNSIAILKHHGYQHAFQGGTSHISMHEIILHEYPGIQFDGVHRHLLPSRCFFSNFSLSRCNLAGSTFSPLSDEERNGSMQVANLSSSSTAQINPKKKRSKINESIKRKRIHDSEVFSVVLSGWCQQNVSSALQLGELQLVITALHKEDQPLLYMKHNPSTINQKNYPS